MFTRATVTHTFTNADGTAASGSLEFTLEAAMTNGSVTLVPGTHASAQLDSSGNVSQELASTQDPDTFSQGLAAWRCDERIAGAPVRSYTFAVPSGGVSVDLGTLMPFVNPPEPG
jgi:hypothetical protein